MGSEIITMRRKRDQIAYMWHGDTHVCLGKPEVVYAHPDVKATSCFFGETDDGETGVVIQLKNRRRHEFPLEELILGDDVASIEYEADGETFIVEVPVISRTVYYNGWCRKKVDE